MKIQVSTETRGLLVKQGDNFILTRRGEVNLKGKGQYRDFAISALRNKLVILFVNRGGNYVLAGGD